MAIERVAVAADVLLYQGDKVVLPQHPVPPFREPRNSDSASRTNSSNVFRASVDFPEEDPSDSASASEALADELDRVSQFLSTAREIDADATATIAMSIKPH